MRGNRNDARANTRGVRLGSGVHVRDTLHTNGIRLRKVGNRHFKSSPKTSDSVKGI